VPSDEIRLYAIGMLHSCTEYGNKSRIAPTEATGVNSFNLHIICAEYGLQPFVAISDEIRL